jgi:hypothetical protein
MGPDDAISFLAPNAVVTQKPMAIDPKRLLFRRGRPTSHPSRIEMGRSRRPPTHRPDRRVLPRRRRTRRGAIRVDIFKARLGIDGNHHELLCQIPSEQFRGRNFPKGDIDQCVAKNHPTIQTPWPHIWFAIRGGLFNIVHAICKAHREQRSTFW